ncbi:hypothetical protein MITS9509_02445 [Synechococcus sp. MIT S9509]|nr:hypothetical protein MITS9504_02265 [Synechococcus sp. MIT S9504]KZR91509.1 hypothetical protein MITS9509_02445 [Synechococcus sp. MIT S9509]
MQEGRLIDSNDHLSLLSQRGQKSWVLETYVFLDMGRGIPNDEHALLA